jgi:hypothetical protein
MLLVRRMRGTAHGCSSDRADGYRGSDDQRDANGNGVRTALPGRRYGSTGGTRCGCALGPNYRRDGGADGRRILLICRSLLRLTAGLCGSCLHIASRRRRICAELQSRHRGGRQWRGFCQSLRRDQRQDKETGNGPLQPGNALAHFLPPNSRRTGPFAISLGEVTPRLRLPARASCFPIPQRTEARTTHDGENSAPLLQWLGKSQTGG